MRNVVGIVLCGGASRRMGQSKADLPFGPETLLERAIRQLLEVVDHVVVAAAPDQPLPAFNPERVAIVRDESPRLGPLHGLSAALAGLPTSTEFAYLAAVDSPRFSGTWLRLLRDRIGDGEAAAAVVDERAQPFSALYRVGPAREAVTRLLAENSRRLSSLLDALDARWIAENERAALDPSGDLFRDVDRPEDYRRALAEMLSEGRFETEGGSPGANPSDPRRSSTVEPPISGPSR